MYLPASSVSTVYARGPGKTPLPSELMVIPTVISSSDPVFPVRVVNFSQDNIWLSPKTRLGTLSPCQCTKGEPCEVKFQRISANHEEVTINQRNNKWADSEVKSLLDQLHMGGTPEERAELAILLKRYADVFAVHNEDLGFTDQVKHEIPLADRTPVSQPYRCIPPNQYQEVREQNISKATEGRRDTGELKLLCIPYCASA